MRRADLIVVGAGVLGTFHAYFAARRGLQTLLLERNALPSDASTRNFGMLPQSIVDPLGPWATFARDSAEIYRAIQREHDISVEGSGSLYLASTELERAVLGEFAERFGGAYRCEYLSPRETVQRYRFVQESYCTGSLLFPDDLSLDPSRMLAQLLPHIVRSGPVEYRPHTTVVAVESCGDHCIVRDARGTTFEAERVVVCSGAECRTLFPEIFTTSGLQVCKLQMMRTIPLSGFRLPHSLLSGLSIRRYPAFTSCPSYERLRSQPVDEELSAYGIHLLVKQARDGSVIIGDSHQYRDCGEAAPLQERTDCAINRAILAYAQTVLRFPSWTIGELWNGYYLHHPHAPIYTLTVDDRIHLVTGIGGKGMTTGPGFARHHVETLLSERSAAG